MSDLGPCEEWLGAKGGGGYGVMWDATQKKARAVTRIEWEAYNGPIPDGMVVRHKCDNPACFRLDHLELGTQGDNVRDMDERGRRKPARKFSDEVIESVLASKEPSRVLAERHGMSMAYVRALRGGYCKKPVARKTRERSAN